MKNNGKTFGLWL